MERKAPTDPREFVLASRLALLDPVTGLPGPALLVDRIEMALARARREHSGIAVYVLYDVVGTPGPAVRETALRLQHAVGPDDTVSRVAGRTFVVVGNAIDTRAVADRVAARLMDHVGDGCRLGLALGTVADDPRELLSTAAHRAVGAMPKGRFTRAESSRRDFDGYPLAAA
jgi:GGDEF domain-containing protein